MKQSITLALIMLYGLALVRPALPLIDYYLQLQQYKEQCINRTRPELHCNGRCILMQKLKAANFDFEQEPAAPPAPVKVNFDDYPLALLDSSKEKLVFAVFSSLLEKDRTSRKVLRGSLDEVFHPPSV